ncbi:MAG TPA: RluA family pseudouridine synthase [Myxococcota bacterium]|nr:RluA family pseudouridine synthase [Myxococcota bacterium]
MVEKPAGLHVFPSGLGIGDSVLTRLLAGRPDLAEIGEAGAPAFVHRLDRSTSGLLLAAKTQAAYGSLRDDFSSGKVHKEYLALVEGSLQGRVEMDVPLGARYRRSRRVSVCSEGRRLRGVRPARTIAEEIAQEAGLTLCRVETATGFRHQVRAHLAHLGHPLAGDRLYGATREIGGLEEHFFLHAWLIELRHPDDGRRLRLCSPLPPAKRSVLAHTGLLEAYNRFLKEHSEPITTYLDDETEG